uniref:Uncharacterized protein n=1 Tax=Agarophyton chilense TaxID=2510777 RepID=O49032_AGACH|nr:ORF10 [Agarophyton chilense]
MNHELIYLKKASINFFISLLIGFLTFSPEGFSIVTFVHALVQAQNNIKKTKN